VPAETRVALAAVARLENYKKDQVWHNSIQLVAEGSLSTERHDAGSSCYTAEYT
jgi:hypothetical protein